MASKIIAVYVTGQTLYALRVNEAGQIWNGSTHETILAANLATYKVAMTEATGTGIYSVDFPATAAGIYNVGVRIQIDASPAWTDPDAGGGETWDWDGTARVLPSKQADVTTLLSRLSALRAGYLDYLAGWTTTIFAQIAGIIWAYATRTLTQSAAQVAATIAGVDITVTRGTTWTIVLTGLPANTGYSKLWFTVKRKKSDADASALCQVLLSAPAAPTTDGLQYFNGAAASDKAKGAITVNSATSITITVAASVTLNSEIYNGAHYDVKMLSGTAVTLLSSDGEFAVTEDITRAVA